MPREVYVLFFARVVNSIGHFVFPFLTLLLTDKLGMSTAEAGRWILFAAVSVIPGSLLGGRLSDTFGRKRVLLVFMAGAAASFLPCVFLGDSIAVAWFILVVQFSVGGVNPPIMALTSDLTTPETGRLLRVLLGRPFLLVFVLAVTLMNFVYAQFTFSVPLQMRELFGEAGPRLFGVINAVNAAIVVGFTAPLVHATRRHRPVVNQSLAGVLFAVGFGMIFWINSFAMFLVAAFVWTIGEILAVTNANVYIVNHTPSSHRGRFNSIIPLIMGTGFALSPALVGAYIEVASLRSVWPLAFAVAMAGALVLLILGEVERRTRGDRGRAAGGMDPAGVVDADPSS
jgi:MFS family permease